MLEAVGGDQNGAHFRPCEMSDDIENLEIGAETLELCDRHDIEQAVVFSAAHGRGHGVEVQFPAEGETAALEGDLVGIDLGAETRASARPRVTK